MKPILSAVTVCLVPQARSGPFVYHGNLSEACAAAASDGFDAIELFAPSGSHVDKQHLASLLTGHGLRLAAVGTGAGMLLHGHRLCGDQPGPASRARDFVKRIIDAGAEFAAPAIIGSMQGTAGPAGDRPAALRRLADSLRELAAHAEDAGQLLLFEPLNRYETDLINTLEQGAELLDLVGAGNLKLLADLFHMNIEEHDIAKSILAAGGRIGHVHFVDSNRRAAGLGHLDYAPIAKALADSGYTGFASAEALPLPTAAAAAKYTIRSYRRFLRNS